MNDLAQLPNSLKHLARHTVVFWFFLLTISIATKFAAWQELTAVLRAETILTGSLVVALLFGMSVRWKRVLLFLVIMAFAIWNVLPATLPYHSSQPCGCFGAVEVGRGSLALLEILSLPLLALAAFSKSLDSDCYWPNPVRCFMLQTGLFLGVVLLGGKLTLPDLTRDVLEDQHRAKATSLICSQVEYLNLPAEKSKWLAVFFSRGCDKCRISCMLVDARMPPDWGLLMVEVHRAEEGPPSWLDSNGPRPAVWMKLSGDGTQQAALPYMQSLIDGRCDSSDDAIILPIWEKSLVDAEVLVNEVQGASL